MIDLSKALNTLKEGGVIVFPTDTVYGLGADSTNPEALEKLYVLKGRVKQPTHVLVDSLEMIKSFAVVNEKEEKIIENLMPGPITLILDLRKDTPETFKTLASELGIGARIPDKELTLELIQEFGFPITAPSANPKGGQTPYTIEESKSQFDQKEIQPDYYLDTGELPKVLPSTLAKISNGEIQILREGPVTREQIEEAIR
jgi:L-threonylcarbamoyladenylate synthase